MKIKITTIFSFLFLFFIALGVNLTEAAVTAPGDIAFIGFNADVDDAFAFVVLADVPATTTIYFTDREWTGAGFNSGEGFVTWVSGGSILPAGSIVSIEHVQSGITANTGTVSKSGSFNLAGANEILYAYIGSSETIPTAFLTALANHGLDNGAATLTGTGLTVDSTAVNLQVVNSDLDVARYIGPRTGMVSFSDYLPLINDMTVARGTGNWEALDDTEDQSGDLPFILSPTAIELSTFTAVAQADGSVSVEWVTASETDHAGYYIQRSDSEAGSLVPVNGAIIASTGIQGQGASYSLLDQSASVGTQWYTLEDIDIHGTRTLHGPISVEVRTPSAISLANTSTTLFLGIPSILLTVVLLIISLTVFIKLAYSHQINNK